MKKNIIVGVSIIDPLVISSNDKYDGFEIDLWEIIANKLDLNFTYKNLEFNKLLPAVKNKKIDVAMAGITRTKEREKFVSFSYFTLRSGLSILLRKEGRIGILKTLKDYVLKNLKKFSKFAVIFFGFIFLISNIFWYFEKDLPNIYISENYWQGVVDSLWWTIILMSGVGGSYPDSDIGKAIGFFLVIFGVAFFAIFIARITSFVTLSKIKYSINSPRDLKDKKVATKMGTTSEEELGFLGAKVHAEKNIEDAFRKLKNDKVDAVVFDEPVIKNFYKNQESDDFSMVEESFNKQTYGIAFQHGSEIRDKFNAELLGLFESGEYDLLYKKWFGN